MSRRFDRRLHLQNLRSAEIRDMFDDFGQRLADIQGSSGARAHIASGLSMGVDKIMMAPGSAFPLHTHEGDHLLYVLEGDGALHIDGVNYVLEEGDSIYVAAEYPHGVIGPKHSAMLKLLAFGIPHHPIDSAKRMRTVLEEMEAKLSTPGDSDFNGEAPA